MRHVPLGETARRGIPSLLDRVPERGIGGGHGLRKRADLLVEPCDPRGVLLQIACLREIAAYERHLLHELDDQRVSVGVHRCKYQVPSVEYQVSGQVHL